MNELELRMKIDVLETEYFSSTNQNKKDIIKKELKQIRKQIRKIMT